MIAVTQAELIKLLRRPGVRVVILLWPFLGFVFGYLIPYLIRNVEEIAAEAGVDIVSSLLPDQFIANSLGGFPLFGFALALILGGLAVGSEYGWGTMGSSLVQGPSRTAVHVGRVVALSLLALVMTILALGVAALTSVIMAALLDQSTSWPSGEAILAGLAGGWLILTVAVVIGATLALLLRSTALAVGLGLVYALVLESLFNGFAGAASWVESIARYLPGTNAGGIAASLADSSTNGGGAPGVTALVDGTHATVVLLAYLVGLTILGLLVFRRRDVAG